MQIKRCKQCGGEFSGRKRSTFCSVNCKNIFQIGKERPELKGHKEGTIERVTCKHCRNIFESYVSHKKKFCSHKCYSEYPKSKEIIEKWRKTMIRENKFLKGKDSPMYSKKMSKESIQKRLKTLEGRFSEIGRKSGETRKRLFKEGKLINWNKGKKLDFIPKMAFKKGNKPWNKGVKGLHLNSKTEFKKGQEPWNKNMIGYMAGEKNGNWMNGKSFEPYGIEFNKHLKLKIKERDNFTCQECGITEDELKLKEKLSYNQSLRIHHLDYCKQNNSPFNLMSLCLRCHWKTNYDREHWEKYFKSKMFIKEILNQQNILIFNEKKQLIGIKKINDNLKGGKYGNI